MTETKTPPKAKKRPRKTVRPKQTAQPAAEPAHDIPVGKIVVGEQHREQFDETKLQQLAASIELDGVLQPVIVRPDPEGPEWFQLVAGERRWRAAQLAGRESVPAIVKDLDDAAVARVRLSENFHREDLNPIEQAQAFLDVREANGWSQRELADHYPDRLSQGKIANAERLLKLPADWQQRVISGEITATQARQLATYADVPAILDNMADIVRKGWLKEWEDQLDHLVEEASRPLSGNFFFKPPGADRGRYTSVALTKKEKQREDLDVREVAFLDGPKEKRAFNVELFDELQLAGEERRQQRQEAKTNQETSDDATQKTQLTPAQKREKTRQAKEAWEKKLTRYYFAWLQREVIAELETLLTHSDAIWQKLAAWFAVQPGPERRLQELVQTVKEMGGREKQKGSGYYSRRDAWATLDTLKCVMDCDEALQRGCLKWVAHEFEGYNADVKPHMLAGLAAELEVSLESHWKCGREFLELHTKDQLFGLIKEWKSETLPGGKRGDIIDALDLESENRTEQPFPPSKDLLKIAKKPAQL